MKGDLSMSLKNFLISFMSCLTFIPATMLCFAPMKNRLKYRRQHILIAICLIAVILFPATSLVEAGFSIKHNRLILPMLALLFVVYHKTLTTHISQSAAIFVLVTALMAFVSNFATAFDAILHPLSDADHFSPEAAAFQTLVCLALFALLYFPFSRYGSYLIDNLNQKSIWYITFCISAIFLIFNLSMGIHHYDTFHTNNVARSYWISMPLMFLLLVLLCTIFYFIVNSLLEKADTEQRNHILEMQEKQYLAQQRYLEQNTKARHDFRQTIHVLKGLAEDGNVKELNTFLGKYIETLPENETVRYCKDNAVNALLNHYAHLAKSTPIRLNLNISLPDALPAYNIDICSVIGNLLENAVNACLNLAEAERNISLSVSIEQGLELYIVMVNNFSGRVKKKGDRYLSTHKNGTGTGLYSIRSTAEQYGGQASFYHKENIFYSDVMMVLKTPKST